MELEKNVKTRKLLQRLLKLEDKVVGKPFPGMKRVRQISSYHCGPAVILELFSFLGRNISQIAVVRSLRAKNKIKRLGLNVSDLARATGILGKKEVVFWGKHQSTINDLSLAINKFGYPVGAGMEGLIIGNNRNLTKRLLMAYDVHTPPFQFVRRAGGSIDEDLGLPLIVKLNEGGGSVGINNHAVKETYRAAKLRVNNLVSTYLPLQNLNRSRKFLNNWLSYQLW